MAEEVAGERGCSAIAQLTHLVEVANGPGIQLGRRIIRDFRRELPSHRQHHVEVGD